MSAIPLLEAPIPALPNPADSGLSGVKSAGAKVPSVPACLPVHRGEDVVAFALVDRALLRSLQRWRWNLDPKGYAYTTTTDGRVSLHRYVTGLRPGEPLEAHHRNAEKLDCRRANLQVLTLAGHSIAHGMRPRHTIAIGNGSADPPAPPAPAPKPAHPAAARGLSAWLEAIRAGDGAEGIGEALMAIRGSRPKRLPQVLTSEETEALMRMPNLGCPTGVRDHALMMLMHRCGLRVSECCGLHLRDVKWAQKQIHLRGEITKGHVEAVVYMDDRTSDVLQRWIDVRRRYAAGKPWLFTTLKGSQLDRRQLWEMVARRARKAGIEKRVGPHTLRHTYATELLREGFNLREVQHLMRHADIRTTVLYTHLFDADLSAKIAARQ